VDFRGQTIFVADAHRDDGKRFVVRADDKLRAFRVLTTKITKGGIAEIHHSYLVKVKVSGQSKLKAKILDMRPRIASNVVNAR